MAVVDKSMFPRSLSISVPLALWSVLVMQMDRDDLIRLNPERSDAFCFVGHCRLGNVFTVSLVNSYGKGRKRRIRRRIVVAANCPQGHKLYFYSDFIVLFRNGLIF